MCAVKYFIPYVVKVLFSSPLFDYTISMTRRRLRPLILDWVRFTEPTEFAVVRGDSVYFYDVQPRTVLDTVLILKVPAEGLIIGTKDLGKYIPPSQFWNFNVPYKGGAIF